MARKGYIKVHRRLLDHWIYKDEQFDKFHAWIDILLLANYKQSKTLRNGEMQIVNAGELLVSDDFLATRWHWSRGKVRRYIDLLQKEGMLSKKRTLNGTSLTVENWAFYQGRGTTDGTTDGTHNKNIKKYIKNTPKKGDKNSPVGEDFFLALMNGEVDDD